MTDRHVRIMKTGEWLRGAFRISAKGDGQTVQGRTTQPNDDTGSEPNMVQDGHLYPCHGT